MPALDAEAAYVAYLERELSKVRGELQQTESFYLALQEKCNARCGDFVDRITCLEERVRVAEREHQRAERNRMFWKDQALKLGWKERIP